MDKLLRKTYKKTQAPRTFRIQLLELLIEGNTVSVAQEGIWRRPAFWALVSAVVTISIVVYGFWLPSHVSL